MLISSAYAADDATNSLAATDTSPLKSVLPLYLVLFLVLYFLLIRPNQKKLREHEGMIKALRRGDKVVTGGGIIGTIHKIDGDDVLVLEVAPDVKIRVMRDTISHVVSKTVANDNKADGKSTDKSNAVKE